MVNVLMLLLAVVVLMLPYSLKAGEPTLSIDANGMVQTYTAAALLARPDSTFIDVPADVSYKRSMHYRAIPLLGLLSAAAADKFDTLEAQATDGFVTQIPLALIEAGAKGGAVAWVAVEDPARPWPAMPGAEISAGPFYLVWQHPERSGVRTEQWPFELAGLAYVDSPVRRWPQLALPSGLPASDPARRGQMVFFAQCLPCHRLKAGGSGEMGPDLGRPMPATQYPDGCRPARDHPQSARRAYLADADDEGLRRRGAAGRRHRRDRRLPACNGRLMRAERPDEEHAP